jgi:hypothetical protein
VTRHVGRHEYAVCSHREPDRCPAFILPVPQRDPTGPAAVIAGYLDVTQALEAAGWDTGRDGDWCPAHKQQRAEERAKAQSALSLLRVKLTTEDVPLPDMETSR